MPMSLEQIDSVISEFVSYMVESGRGRPSIYQYSLVLRRVFKSGLPHESLAELKAYETQLALTAVSPFRSAWNAYADFMINAKRVAIPTIVGTRSAGFTPQLTDEMFYTLVSRLMRNIAPLMSSKSLVALRWDAIYQNEKSQVGLYGYGVDIIPSIGFWAALNGLSKVYNKGKAGLNDCICPGVTAEWIDQRMAKVKKWLKANPDPAYGSRWDDLPPELPDGISFGPESIRKLVRGVQASRQETAPTSAQEMAAPLEPAKPASTFDPYPGVIPCEIFDDKLID